MFVFLKINLHIKNKYKLKYFVCTFYFLNLINYNKYLIQIPI